MSSNLEQKKENILLGNVCDVFVSFKTFAFISLIISNGTQCASFFIIISAATTHHLLHFFFLVIVNIMSKEKIRKKRRKI